MPAELRNPKKGLQDKHGIFAPFLITPCHPSSSQTFIQRTELMLLECMKIKNWAVDAAMVVVK